MSTSSIENSTIKAYLKQRKAEVEAVLFTLLPAPEGHAKPLVEAMRYSLEAGGKRIRPILTLIGADYCRGVAGDDLYAGQYWGGVVEDLRDALLRTACSIEMIHTYSLIHDDLPCMDDDELRRGRPTLHIVHGEAMAVLAADALQTLGFQILADLPEVYALPALRASRALAHASGCQGMVAGQAVDLEYEEKAGNESVLEYIHLHKTAALIRAPLLMGAHLVSGSEADLRTLEQVGGKLGLIFQVVDDILDVIGDTAVMGKKAGSDESQHKLTYPALIGLDASKARVQELYQEVLDLLEPEGGRARVLLDITRELVNRKA
ncbi:MAG: polyprenyl synthetase family protein [bacterium]|jgi:geranylgeranyl diphosphate synthase type II|nr:polyprenyl synthetase family protein [bacterium]